jgi:hypothetical protein
VFKIAYVTPTPKLELFLYGNSGGGGVLSFFLSFFSFFLFAYQDQEMFNVENALD